MEAIHITLEWIRQQRTYQIIFLVLVISLLWPASLFSGLVSQLHSAYLMFSTSQHDRIQSIWLPDYKLVAPPVIIGEDGDNLSGLTWNQLTSTLFMVRNSPAEVLELTASGHLLRTIKVDAAQDIEAITWTGGDQFVIADERRQHLALVNINETTDRLDLSQMPGFTFNIDAGENKGFEGLAWNPRTQSLLVAKERDPMALYEIAGLAGKRDERQVLFSSPEHFHRSAKVSNTDYSGLHFDDKTGHLLVLGDESRRLTEMDDQGKIVSYMELSDGWHGLEDSIPQPEGVTMDDDGNLYVISEPNLFYRFEKP
ncbi:MAG: SdiA-regulated domain-containing protein [Endozoicomonas sp.]